MDAQLWPIVFLGVVMFILLFWWFARRSLRFAAKPLLTRNELEFYGRLRKALPDFLIFPQVALRAFIRPGSPSRTRRYDRESGMLGAKHCDFLVCRPDTLEVIVIIELDDRTHDKATDALRDRMTSAAGYRTLRFESKRRPTVQDIRKDVLEVA